MSDTATLISEQQALERLKNETRKTHEFFGNKGKQERERISVAELLSLLGLQYTDDEMISEAEGSKTDVRFRDASFQIKELMNEGFPRNGVYKNARNAVESAANIQEINWNLKAYDIPECAKLYDLVVRFLGGIACKYTDKEKNQLDLLIYSTRTHASQILETEIQRDDFKSFEWRSVMCVSGNQAAILFSSASSPVFIRNQSKAIFGGNRIPILLSGDQP